ncbi:MAG TPA: hypothetical protein IAC43_05185 [Candidatus Faecivivens stercoripullorum]|uniref:Lipoprotein n=1 Tax=Candidatus Faecivivens stercoripullorum TaxID=2840805 RepID=A0A9D1KSV5_9FIRM|nr:hypothetical protein [Candidatus Faecivivens stercoripullorum]
MMKRFVCMLLTVLCIVGLTGCSRFGMKSPPKLVVKCSDGSVSAILGTYSWQYMNTGVTADAIHPLDNNNYKILETTDTAAVLEFAKDPDSILNVICWSDTFLSSSDAESEKVDFQDNTIQLKPGGYIYQVAAEWDTNGTAYYSFYIKTEGDAA